MAKQYDTDTEVMRIIAAFFVVMIHASGLGSFSAVVYNSVARFSVPVFVIISGYYLLTCPPKGTALGKKGAPALSADAPLVRRVLRVWLV